MREDFQVPECYPLCSTDQCCGSTGVDAVTYQRLPPISLSNANVSQGCPSVPPAKCKTMSNCQCLPCGENCHFYKCNNLWCNDQCEGCHSQHQQIEVEVDLRKEPLSDPTDDCLTAVNKYRAQAGKSPISNYCQGSYQDLAKQMATWDATHGAHNWVNTKNWTGSCPGFNHVQLADLEAYQNEFGWNEYIDAWTWDEVVECWFNEGPDGSPPGPPTQHHCQNEQGQHGHYNALVSDTACIACGYGTGDSNDFMFTTNFCPQNTGSIVTMV